MSIYIIIFLIIFVFALLEQFNYVDNLGGLLTKKYLYYLVVVILIFFAGARYNIGIDYFSYKEIYKQFGSHPFVFQRYEPGFNFIVYLCKNILNLPYNYFLFIFSIFAVVIKAEFFRRYFQFPCFLLMLYYPAIFLYADFGQVRQGMAVGIFLWSIPAIKNRQFLLYIIILLLACSFHYSAVICFPLYWLYKITITKKIFLLGIVIGFLFNLLGGAGILLESLGILVPPFRALLTYIRDYGTTFSPIGYFKEFGFILSVLVILLYQYEYQKEILTRNEKNLEFSVYNIFCILILCIKFLDSIYVIGYRGAYFYKILEGSIFYYFSLRLKEKELKLLLWCFLVIYSIIRIFHIINGQTQFYLEYQIYKDLFGI